MIEMNNEVPSGLLVGRRVEVGPTQGLSLQGFDSNGAIEEHHGPRSA
jgi:hypothetical protein